MKRGVLVLAVLTGMVMVEAPAYGESEAQVTPLHRLSYTNLTVARQNPEGLQDDFKLTYRYRLYGEKPGLLFKESEMIAGATTYLTPAFVRMGGRVGIRPLAILYLEARMDWMGSFGVLGHVMGFDSPLSDASDDAREERKGGPNGEISTTGHLTTLTAELRGKVGDVVVRSRGSMIRSVMDLNDGDTVWYEGVNDVLMPQDGWALHMDNDLLWMGPNGWVAGLRHSMDQVFYPNEESFPSDGLEELTPNHRVGPLVAYSFYDEPGTAFNKPTLVLILNWHLKHRYRTGEEVSQAIPYGLIAFAFSGDLLSSSP